MSTYRVIIAGSTHPDGAEPGTWCADNGRRIWDDYGDAYRFACRMTELYPTIDYRVICTTGLSDQQLGAIVESYATSPTRGAPAPIDNDDDQEDDDVEDDDEPIECDDCGHYDVDDCYHEFYYCADCGWGCEAPDCRDCLTYSDRYGDDLCDSCYDDHHRSSEGSPGPPLRRCSTCNSGDVHHDEVNDKFVCDHTARQLLDSRYPVRLAHELPTLEAA